VPLPPRAALALVVLLAACGGDRRSAVGPEPPAPPTTASARTVRIQPRDVTLELVDTARLRVTVLDSAGRPLTGLPVTWTGGEYPTVLLGVDSTGLVRSTEREGIYQVTARVGSVADTVSVSVRSRISMLVWPDTNVLFPGMSRALAVRRWDADSGGLAPLGVAAWETSDPAVATVDAAGRVTAVRGGHATITATRGDRTKRAEVYVLAPPRPLRFVEIRAGALFTCARTAEGEAYCWGTGAALGTEGPTDRCEYLGYTVARRPRPARTTVRCGRIPLRVGGEVRFASLADGSACGLTADGTAYCWGNAVAVGTPPPSTPLPRPVVGLPAMRQLAGTCGVSVEGELHCWGNELPFSPAARLPLPRSGKWAQVSVAALHRCALTTDGTAYCWGLNGQGELGVASQGPDCATVAERCAEPVPVATADRFVAIGAGQHYGCGLRADGRVLCWGYGAGQPWRTIVPPIVLVPTEAVAPAPLTSLSIRGYQACGLDAAGATYCWGIDIPGGLATGSMPGGSPARSGQDVFARALPPFPLRQVAAGGYHLCGIATDGIAWCWGGADPVAWGAGLVDDPGAQRGPVRVAGQ
jgi:alpha-tubulin suppressor-like RCC1 family protein